MDGLQKNVSIIIPCYNNEMHLSNCFQSIVNQSHQLFEIIFINDGSVDNSEALLLQFKIQDDRVKIFTQVNKGASSARNRGVIEASYDIIAFIDADDTVKSDYLTTLLQNFDNDNFLICGTINVKGHHVIEKKSYKILIEKFINSNCNPTVIDLVRYDTLGSPCARLYRKSVIMENKVFFRENLSYQEDLFFNLEYYKFFKSVKILNYFGYNYIEHKISSSIKYHHNFNHIKELYELLLQSCNCNDDIIIIKKFILQTCLKKLANIFHADSMKSNSDKLSEIKELFTSNYYSSSVSYVDELSINKLLVYILKSKSTVLLFIYYKLLH